MKLYVGNLSKQTTDAELNELGTPYGSLVSADVVMDKASGESKGFGFMEFSSDEAGRAAITGLHGREVNGQAIKVEESKKRDPGPARI